MYSLPVVTNAFFIGINRKYLLFNCCKSFEFEASVEWKSSERLERATQRWSHHRLPPGTIQIYVIYTQNIIFAQTLSNT